MTVLNSRASHLAAAALACLCTGVVPGQGELPLPSFEELGTGDPVGAVASPTRWLTPTLVATPPASPASQSRRLRQEADFRPWRAFGEAGEKTLASLESRKPTTVAAVPASRLRAVMLLPGLPPGDEADRSMEAYAASVPVPPGLKGVRDYGADLPESTLEAIGELLGESFDDTLLPRIREAIILGFLTEKRKLDGILVPEMGADPGVLKLVVIEALSMEGAERQAAPETSNSTR